MFSKRVKKPSHKNETNEKTCNYSRIKNANFKLLSLNNFKKLNKTFLSKFKAKDVASASNLKKHSSLPLNATLTRTDELPNEQNTNRTLSVSELNIYNESASSSIVNLTRFNNPNESKNNTILEYLLNEETILMLNNITLKSNEEINETNSDEINSSIVIHSDSSETDEGNQTFLVLSDSKENLSPDRDAFRNRRTSLENDISKYMIIYRATPLLVPEVDHFSNAN